MGNRDEMFGFAVAGALLVGTSVWMFLLERFGVLVGTGLVQAFTLGLGLVMLAWTYFRNR